MERRHEGADTDTVRKDGQDRRIEPLTYTQPCAKIDTLQEAAAPRTTRGPARRSTGPPWHSTTAWGDRVGGRLSGGGICTHG